MPSYSKISTVALTFFLATLCESFSTNNSPRQDIQSSISTTSSSRRSFFTKIAPALILTPALITNPEIASAGIDPNALKILQVEGDATGAATRLRQLQEEKVRPEDTIQKPFEDLSGGVSFREYREGKGEAVVQNGSKVAVEMTIRCKSFATNNEPGGLKYFSTKDDTDFNEVAWTVGSGELPPGLEEAMMGMRKNAVRRIELPSTMVFAAKKNNQLPLPKATNKDGKRRYDNLFKTDATLLFEVLVTRIK